MNCVAGSVSPGVRRRPKYNGTAMRVALLTTFAASNKEPLVTMANRTSGYCTTNNHILLQVERISSSSFWNEHVNGSVRGRSHGGEDGPSFFRNFITVAVLNFLNQAMMTKQAKLAADGR